MECKIIRATKGPKHHFFGFHDLVAFNQSDDKLLSLEVDVINRPPLPGEKARVGYINLSNKEFIELGKTNAYNFPQGARQQWINDNLFIVNNQVGNVWGADIYDVSLGRKVSSLQSTCHSLSKDGQYAYGLNYARLYRLGGYGYVGLKDAFASSTAPSDDGIYVTHVETGETKLLVSTRDVALCGTSDHSMLTFHHYLTHLYVNPNNQRIAFLHRFILPDGGLRTRLMTIGTDGSGLRCLAEGFLSHFSWKDEETLFIYGRTNTKIDKLRSSSLLLRNPFLALLARKAKHVLQRPLRRKLIDYMSFILVKDEEEPMINKVAEGVITSDGHPMFSPTDDNLIVCDTYPDEEKCRDLFLYDFKLNKRLEIGRFRMSAEAVDMSLSDRFFLDMETSVLGKVISFADLSFARSGLHCDLHPRWNHWGTKVAFDSIHEGTRQLYIYALK